MLNRRFALPALCALGVHSGLFFAFPKSVVLTTAIAVPRPPVLENVPFERFEEPSLSKETPDEPISEAKIGEGIPVSEIDIPSMPKPGAFVIDVAPRTEAADLIGDRIPVIGAPGGSPFGDAFATAAPKILNVGNLDRTPEVRARPAPLYPPSARQEGLAGSVEVEFVVGPSGDVLRLRVLSSSDRRFEEPTLKALAKWRFEPGRKDGRAVAFRMRQTVSFGLSD